MPKQTFIIDVYFRGGTPASSTYTVLQPPRIQEGLLVITIEEGVDQWYPLDTIDHIRIVKDEEDV